MTRTSTPQFFSSMDAGAYLGIDSSMVRRYCIEGRLKAQKLGSLWLLTREELDRFKAIPRMVGNPNFRKRGRQRKK